MLKPGGPFHVWDMALPARHGERVDSSVIPLTVKLPEGEVETGYGTRGPEVSRDLAYYVSHGVAAGFDVIASDQHVRLLRLHFRKPT